MRSSSHLSLVALLAASLVFACKAGSDDGGGGSAPVGGTNAGGSNPGGSNEGGQGVPGGSTSNIDPSGGGTTQPGCDAQPNQDKDKDGFTINDGDCNDCDANVNPGAIEVIGSMRGGEGGGGTGGAGGTGTGGTGGAGGAPEYVPADEDCDGEADNVAEPDCDAGLQLASTDPLDGARAIELCKQAASETDWGLIAAAYVSANGAPKPADVKVGILSSFGTNVPPQQGASVLALSSGTARLPGQPGACTNNACGVYMAQTAPPNFPANVPGCPIAPAIHDDIALEVTLRAPTNATGYKFDFKFTSFEFAEYVCTNFNDQFIALVNPPPMGAQDGNISFDAMGNPVSVNIAFFDVCEYPDDFAANCYAPSMCPMEPAGLCSAGGSQLIGTGFDNGFGSPFPEDAGGTSWLRTEAPVEGGSAFAIRFAIWDTGDSSYDSTAIVDNFQWIADGGTVLVGTNPVPE